MTGTESASLEVLVIQPDPGCTLAEYEAILRQENLIPRTIKGGQDVIPASVDEDALIVLGGAMGANDDAEHPWLLEVGELIRQTMRRGRPVLGICLGAQLLAKACDGIVVRGDSGPEVGLVEVDWRPEAQEDPLTCGLPGPFPVAASHLDMIAQLPPGAVWLGGTSQYPHQVFRVGANAWGVQFHPEVLGSGLAEWAEAYAFDDSSLSEALKAGAEELSFRESEVRDATAKLARRFAKLVRMNDRPRPATPVPVDSREK